MAKQNLKHAASVLALLAMTAAPAMAEIKIGYLSDLSGGTSMLTGESSIPAIRMAIEDFGGAVNGEPVVLITADHLNKPDAGLATAREWVDTQNVDLMFSVDNSAVALAVSSLLKDRNVSFFHGASTTALTGESCGPNQMSMLIDNFGLAQAISIPLVKSGNDKWFYLTIDYAFGHNLESTSRAATEAAGGTVTGAVRHSPTATDFSALLLEAQASGANTIGLATFGASQVAIAKQAQEFGVDQVLAPFFLGDTDIHAAGLDSFQNVRSAIQFYWNQNDATRAFAERYQQHYNRPPTFTNAMHYEFVRHYLQSIQDVGSSADALAITRRMREVPMPLINGDTAVLREDGRTVRPMYAYRTLTPDESKGAWDYLEILATIPGDSLVPPLSESTCALVNKG